MCRALKLLCVAPDGERLGALKRASVSANWELTGGAMTMEGLTEEIRRWRPDVVVLDGELGVEAILRTRAEAPTARVVVVGIPPTGVVSASEGGADATVESLDRVREAVLGLPPGVGPVRA